MTHARLVQLGSEGEQAAASLERSFDGTIHELGMSVIEQRLAAAAIDWFPRVLPLAGTEPKRS